MSRQKNVDGAHGLALRRLWASLSGAAQTDAEVRKAVKLLADLCGIKII